MHEYLTAFASSIVMWIAAEESHRFAEQRMLELSQYAVVRRVAVNLSFCYDHLHTLDNLNNQCGIVHISVMLHRASPDYGADVAGPQQRTNVTLDLYSARVSGMQTYAGASSQKRLAEHAAALQLLQALREEDLLAPQIAARMDERPFRPPFGIFYRMGPAGANDRPAADECKVRLLRLCLPPTPSLISWHVA